MIRTASSSGNWLQSREMTMWKGVGMPKYTVVADVWQTNVASITRIIEATTKKEAIAKLLNGADEKRDYDSIEIIEVTQEGENNDK